MERHDRDQDVDPEAIASLLRKRLDGGDLWVEARGESMRPTLDESARVRIRRSGRPRPGEVWAFVGSDGSIVVHRCLRRFDAGYYGFRGDGISIDDAPVASTRLIGRVSEAQDSRGTRRVKRSTARVVHAQLRRVGKFTRSSNGR